MKALIVIDVQNSFIKERTDHLPKKIAGYIKRNEFQVIVFTKFVNKPNSNFVHSLKWKKSFDPPETDIADELKAWANKENTFKKASYSVFKSVPLKKYLQKHEVDELVMCGVDTDACVLASAYEAFDLGYKVHIPKELCASAAKEDLHSVAMAILKRNIELK